MPARIAVVLLIASAVAAQTPKDEVKALEKSCKGGAAPDCVQLAERYVEGQGVSRDEEKATDYYEKACGLGLGPACLELAHRRRSGKGTKPDVEKAAELYQQVCTWDIATGCAELARHAGSRGGDRAASGTSGGAARPRVRREASPLRAVGSGPCT